MQPEPATLQENNTCTVRWQDGKHFTAIVIKIGEEEELEQYYNDYLGPSDHESSGSTCSTAYDSGASPSPPDSPIHQVKKKRGKKTAGVSEEDTALGAKSNLTTLIRESRKYIEKTKRDYAKQQKAKAAVAAKQAGDRMLSYLKPAQCTHCQDKDLEIASLKRKVRKLEEERVQKQQGLDGDEVKKLRQLLQGFKKDEVTYKI